MSPCNAKRVMQQEVLTLGVQSWRSCVYKGFTEERHEEVQDEADVSTSLHWTFPRPRELWNCGIQVDLPPSLPGVHDLFHVLKLKKCLKAPMDVALPEVTPLKADLTYPMHPIKILDQKNCVTRHKTIKFFKVQWSNYTEEEAV
jgi:hypothetical protein